MSLGYLNHCWFCGVTLGPDNYDGTCTLHDGWPFRDEHGRFRKLTPEERKAREWSGEEEGHGNLYYA